MVRDLLGSGGMGAVFLADDLTLERTVAIKVLPPEVSGDRTVVQRFQREAKTAAKLDHPHIIPIYRVESESGLHYFVMKYVAGRSLESVLDAEAPVPLPFAMRVLREAAAALGQAHRHGVVHRDVKPANIMLDADERVILTDFGISKALRGDADTTSQRLTQVGSVVGTPHYMAPEQAVGRAVDGRADQYALAIVGFEMLTGRLPFNDETPNAIIHRHINEAPPRLSTLRPDLPANLGTAIARALSKAPSHRFAKMEEFIAALDGTPAVPTVFATVADARAVSTPAAASSVAATYILPHNEPAGGTSKGRLARAVATTLSTIMLISMVAAATGWPGDLGSAARRQLDRVASIVTSSSRTEPAPVGANGDNSSPTARRTSSSTPSNGAGASVSGASPQQASSKSRQTAKLSIASKPRGTVVIDGVRVGDTPIKDRPLTVGRAYGIRVERPGYRTKRETITVTSSRGISRQYVLDRIDQR